MFTDLRVTSVNQFQNNITNESLKRLEDKLVTRLQGEQNYLVRIIFN